MGGVGIARIWAKEERATWKLPALRYARYYALRLPLCLSSK